MNEYLGGATSVVETVFLQSSASTSGGGLPSLTSSSSGLTCYYITSNGTASVAVSLTTIATLGTYTSGGFAAIDNTNMPGLYEFHPPNAAFASGPKWVAFYFQGAANLVPRVLKYRLEAVNPDSATTFVSSVPAVTGAVGSVTAAVRTTFAIVKNTAFNNFEFPMNSSTSPYGPLTGLGTGITGTVSIDGGAFTALTNASSEIGGGMYKINLAAADVNGNNLTLQFTDTGALATLITIVTQS